MALERVVEYTLAVDTLSTRSVDALTAREREVTALLAQGMTNRQIAEQLVISEDTVKTHVRSIFRKLGVTDRAQAVSVALRESIFK